jgi:hypothetical protein
MAPPVCRIRSRQLVAAAPRQPAAAVAIPLSTEDAAVSAEDIASVTASPASVIRPTSPEVSRR